MVGKRVGSAKEGGARTGIRQGGFFLKIYSREAIHESNTLAFIWRVAPERLRGKALNPGESS